MGTSLKVRKMVHLLMRISPCAVHRRDGAVVRASASQSVNLTLISLAKSDQRTLDNSIQSLAVWRPAHKRKSVEEKPVNSLAAFLGKALGGMTKFSLCGR